MIERRCCIAIWVAATLFVACGPKVARRPSGYSTRICVEADTNSAMRLEDNLAIGDEVRGLTPERPVIQGFVASLADTVLDIRVTRSALLSDTILASPQTEHRVDLQSLERLEDRDDTTRRGTVLGVLLGGLTGLAGGPLVAAIGMFMGGAVGTGIGAASATETWVPIEYIGSLTLVVAPVGAKAYAPAREPRIYTDDRVRVNTTTIGTTRLIGTVTHIASDTLTLRLRHQEAAVRVPVDSISRLELSLGPKSRWAGFAKGFGWGAFAGVALGVTIGLAGGDEGANEDNGPILFSTAGENAIFLGAFFGALFGAIGGTIGALNPGERWAVVEPLDFSMEATPDGRARLSLTVSRRF